MPETGDRIFLRRSGFSPLGNLSSRLGNIKHLVFHSIAPAHLWTKGNRVIMLILAVSEALRNVVICSLRGILSLLRWPQDYGRLEQFRRKGVSL